jgi:uncharacterized protein (DUF427 family)
LGGSLTTLGYSASRKTTIDVTNLIVPQASIRGLNMFAQPQAAITHAWNVIVPLLKTGAIKPIVAKTFPLAEAADALRYLIDGRPFGRVVLTIWRTYDHKINFEQKGRRNMKEKQIKLPSPDHPISIQRNPARVVVSAAGRVIADTGNALTLREADYPAVQYIPREDVDFSQLERTDHATYCPYKGECSYYSVPAGGEKSVNAVWTYEDPFSAVAQISGHFAFYPDRVDNIAEQLPTTPESLKSS